MSKEGVHISNEKIERVIENGSNAYLKTNFANICPSGEINFIIKLMN